MVSYRWAICSPTKTLVFLIFPDFPDFLWQIGNGHRPESACARNFHQLSADVTYTKAVSRGVGPVKTQGLPTDRVSHRWEPIVQYIIFNLFGLGDVACFVLKRSKQ